MPAPSPNPATRSWLLQRSRATLARRIGVEFEHSPPPNDPALGAPARVFVSWHLDGKLVGCMGTLEPRPSLLDAVDHFAIASGLKDPRSSGVTAEQFPRLGCEVSILSDPEPIDGQGLSDIEAALEPGRHGVILRLFGHKAVYLPVVWTLIPQPSAFLEALCRKAGLEPQRDGEKVSGWTFTTETFGDLPTSSAHGTQGAR